MHASGNETSKSFRECSGIRRLVPIKNAGLVVEKVCDVFLERTFIFSEFCQPHYTLMPWIDFQNGFRSFFEAACRIEKPLKLPIGTMLRSHQADRTFREAIGRLHVGHSITQHCLDEGQEGGDFR